VFWGDRPNGDVGRTCGLHSGQTSTDGKQLYETICQE
jgi:hypothetical protein